MKFTAQGELPEFVIKSQPEDRFWKNWEGREPEPWPEAGPFDLKKAGAHLRSLKSKDRYEHGIMWAKSRIAPALSLEEARFWFLVMVDDPDPSYYEMSLAQNGAYIEALPEKIRTLMAETPELTLDEVRRRMLVQGAHWAGPQIVLPLYRLLGLEGLTELLCHAEFFPPEVLDANDPEQGGRNSRDYLFHRLSKGFRTFLLPYLTEDDLARARGAMGPEPVDPENQEGYYRLAACVKNYAAVRSILNRPEVLLNYRDPLAVVLGLASPEELAAALRRVPVRVMDADPYTGRDAVRLYVSLTGWGALDVVAESAVRWITQNQYYELVQPYGNEANLRSWYAEFERVCIKPLTRYRVPEMAAVMLTIEEKTRVKVHARQWLWGHPELTIAGLLPLAAGDGALSAGAVRWLNIMRRRGYGDLIQAQLAGFDDPTDAARVRARVLENEEARTPALDKATTPAWLTEGLAAGSAPAKKWRDWDQLEMLPGLKIEAGFLTRAQITRLLRVLGTTPLTGRALPLFAELRAQVPPEALDAFLWGLYDRWMDDCFEASGKWVITALGLLGNDATAVKLAGLVRKWPGANQTPRAGLGLEVLAAIGSDAALMQINSMAQKAQFKALKAKAQAAMETIAAARNLTGEQLADRLVPDCGLAAGGGRVFDFGPRKFSLVLGPDFKPWVRDEAGNLKDELPKPNSKDAAEKAKEALADWKELKAQIREVADVQVRRLEQAMVNQRRWTAAEFRLLFVEQPFMVHVARRLLWGGYDTKGQPAVLFRITEDGTAADVHDEGVVWNEAWAVGVVHPLELSAEQRAVWGELFSDYEIATPFPQLGREVYAATAEELTEGKIGRFGGVKIPAPALVGTLERLGWQRDRSEDQGKFISHVKFFPQAGITALVVYEGVWMGFVLDAGAQALEEILFVRGQCPGKSYFGEGSWLSVLPAEVDPVVLSEVLRDLTMVAGKGS